MAQNHRVQLTVVLYHGGAKGRGHFKLNVTQLLQAQPITIN